MTLKPMNVGEILDNTFKMFKEQFKSYLAIAALGAVPAVGFSLLVQYSLYSLFGPAFAPFTPFDPNAVLDVAAFDLLVKLLPFILVTVILTAVVYLIMSGGLIKKASAQVLGREISVREAYRFGFRKVWPLFLGYLLYGLVIAIGIFLLGLVTGSTMFFAGPPTAAPPSFLPVIIGFVLLFIFIVYISIRFAFFQQAIIIEDKGPWSALKRSFKLVKGSWWRSFGIIILITILVSILSNIVALPLGLLSIWLLGESWLGPAGDAILSTFISYLFMPFSIIAISLLYYDLRIRQENLDLELMIDNLTESS